MRALRPLVGISVTAMAAVAASWMQPSLVAAPAAKVDLCHRTGVGYQAINVSANAVPAHLAHGDVLQPNGLVPDGNGFVFDASCNVVSWVYGVNVAPDASAEDPATPGYLYVGSGIPAQDFGTATNVSAGVQLGMMVLYRQGPTVTTPDTYADGVLHVGVNSGPQSTLNGSPDNPARAAWNFTFSVATGLNGATTNLNDFTIQLKYDVDPGPGTSFRTLTLEPGGGGSSGFQWRDQGTGLVFIADDEGTVNVTQNSENYAFGFFQAFPPLSGSLYTFPNGFTGPAAFDLVLQAFSGAQLVVRNSVVVDVANP